MICEEFRDRWEDRDCQTIDALEHRSGCAGCAAWIQRQSAFESMLRVAMVVAPPPDLIVRLRQIPAAVYATVPAASRHTVGTTPTPYSLALEAALIALIGFAAIAFGRFDLLAGFEVDITGAIPHGAEVEVDPERRTISILSQTAPA